MPRHLRVHAPGLLYHIMVRGNNGQPIFLKSADYESFQRILHVVRERYPFYLYAYVLMPNHFHLLLEVSQAPTGRLMQSLLTAYAHEFNRKHGRRGHLFQGRYKAIACERESYLLELVRYIHLNPVRAKLVRRPGEWRWSGHGEYLRREERGLIDSGPVMGELGTPAHYEAFVREGVKGTYRPEWHPGDRAPFLGSEGFVKKVIKVNEPQNSGKRTTMEALLKRVAAQARLSVEVLKEKGRSAAVVEARDSFMWQAVTAQGYQAAEVAAFLRCDPSNQPRAAKS
jgi:REP element-mobilizing transposase RayT